MSKSRSPSETPSFITDFDLHLMAEGNHYRMYEKLGAHVTSMDGRSGTFFSVWAPNAEAVSVIGPFNDWTPDVHRMHSRPLGVWELFIPDVGPGTSYKYRVNSRFMGYRADKADPYGTFMETRPRTASIVWPLDYEWHDAEWMERRTRYNVLDSPMSAYEVHLGSWRRKFDENNRWLTYRELAEQLPDYVHKMGFTHIELMPPTEHPFDGSWGYQTVGYFAPTSRFGTPQDFMHLIDTLHQYGIGVIIDWVPAHFPRDEFALGYFDGTHLYEHSDPRKGLHPEWDTAIFNYGRTEVRNFLLSSAVFWLDKYHIDGIRVDAVASMLHLDYGRPAGTWEPNQYGGRENLEAVEFVRHFNQVVHGEFPGVMTIAEESTDWPGVSRPVYLGGLGFTLKWNMGWMHDVLDYMEYDPVYRSYHHNLMTFGMLYNYSENFLLPFSHDEVVHLKKSMLSKMPGDNWRQHAQLRLLYGWWTAHPGKKLLFMGQEFGQWTEWNHDFSLDWHALDHSIHQGLLFWVRDLLHMYKSEPAMWELDNHPSGFRWIDCHDNQGSTFSLYRQGKDRNLAIIFVCNFTPVVRYGYRIGAPFEAEWQEILNSDAGVYGGSNVGNGGRVVTDRIPHHGYPQSLNLTVPPFGCVVLKATNPTPEPEMTEKEPAAAAERLGTDE